MHPIHEFGSEAQKNKYLPQLGNRFRERCISQIEAETNVSHV